MRHFIFIVFVFSILSCKTPTYQKFDLPITANEKRIAKELIQGAFDDLWAGMDTTKILDYHTPDFIILEHGEVWDNERILEYMRGASEDRAKRLNAMEYISIEKYGSSIQLAYHNTATFYRQDSLLGSMRWLESAVAVETSQGWRLKMMHSTRMKKK